MRDYLMSNFQSCGSIITNFSNFDFLKLFFKGQKVGVLGAFTKVHLKNKNLIIRLEFFSELKFFELV